MNIHEPTCGDDVIASVLEATPDVLGRTIQKDRTVD